MAIFCKVLQNTDVERRLSLPETCIKEFQLLGKGTDMDLQVKDESSGTKVWTFRCRIPTGYPKPVIVGDWLQFVRNKDLKQGDVIIFSKEKDSRTRTDYKITFKKKLNIACLR